MEPTYDPPPQHADSTLDLARLALGDIVTMPDGRSLAVRSQVTLEHTVGSMAGFVLLGELEVLLAVPSSQGAPVNVYLPVARFPVEPSNARTAAEGAARYWAPHLPAFGKAMGEILYKVVEVRGSVDPIVIVYRGADAVVFVRTSFVWSSDLQMLCMSRDDSNESVAVGRHTGVVPTVPSYVPQPSREPAPGLYEVFTGAAQRFG